MDKLVARNPLHLNLLSTSPEVFIDKKQFLFEVSYTVSQYLITRDLIAVRQEVNTLEISVVVQELEFRKFVLAFIGTNRKLNGKSFK